MSEADYRTGTTLTRLAGRGALLALSGRDPVSLRGDDIHCTEVEAWTF